MSTEPTDKPQPSDSNEDTVGALEALVAHAERWGGPPNAIEIVKRVISRGRAQIAMIAMIEKAAAEGRIRFECGDPTCTSCGGAAKERKLH